MEGVVQDPLQKKLSGLNMGNGHKRTKVVSDPKRWAGRFCLTEYRSRESAAWHAGGRAGVRNVMANAMRSS